MQIYQTDELGLWDGNTDKFARPDPVVPGEYLIPGGCVTIAPPALGANEAAQWLDGTWKVVPDFRGLTYWMSDRSMHTIADVGTTPPSDHLTADPGPTAAQQWAAFQQAAQSQLAENDRVAIRCAKAGVAYPDAWLATDQALRLIVAAHTGTAGVLPTKPPYPAGT